MAFDIVAFQSAFPAFQGTSTASIQAWVNIVQGSPMASWFSSATPTQQQLIVAHVGFLLSQATATSNAQGGAVTSATEGSVSASFVAPPVRDGLEFYLSGSTYGQMLWAMLNISSAGGVYIGGLPERSAYRKAGGVFC